MINIRTIILILSLIGIYSCNQQENQNKSINFSNGSKWTFIKKGNKIGEKYAEIEFRRNSTLLIHSEINGDIGPFSYRELGDSLTFNNINFSISPNTNGSIILRNHNEEFLLYKIPFEERNLKSNQIDPFYIRRCYFLVNLNIISTDDAIKYLLNITTQKDSIPEDEIILSNH